MDKTAKLRFTSFLALLLSIGVSAAAATIAGSATCEANDQSGTVTQTESSSLYGTIGCSVTTPAGGTAHAFGSIGGGTNDGFSYFAQSITSGESRPYTYGFNNYASYSESLSYTELLKTAGPIRPGYLHYSVTLVGDKGYNGFADGSVNLGYVSCKSVGPGFYAIDCGGAPKASKVLVTIGTPFSVGISNDSGSQAFLFADGSAGAIAESGFSLEFFEADGITPVSLAIASAALTTPEPATFLLAIGAVICAWCLRDWCRVPG